MQPLISGSSTVKVIGIVSIGRRVAPGFMELL
jgi:hypothetical protein